MDRNGVSVQIVIRDKRIITGITVSRYKSETSPIKVGVPLTKVLRLDCELQLPT